MIDGTRKKKGDEVRLSTVVLLTIGTFDLVTTLIWLNRGGAEGNPLFAEFARHGSLALVFAKLIYLIIPVLILEYARSKRPISGELGTWIAAALYAYLYIRSLLALY